MRGKAVKLSNNLEQIKQIYGEDILVTATNAVPLDITGVSSISAISEKNPVGIDTHKISATNEIKVLKVLLYSFIAMAAVICIINIFNAISASVHLRKREFATLKSIGMSNGKISKMLLLEATFYWIIASVIRCCT